MGLLNLGGTMGIEGLGACGWFLGGVGWSLWGAGM